MKNVLDFLALAVDSGSNHHQHPNHSRPHQMAGGTQYRGLQSFESQPSPAPSRRSQRQASPAPSRKSHRQATMQSYASAGDLSTYGETNTNSHSTPLLLAGSHLTLLISSLLMIGTGAGLMGFYRLHTLEIISIKILEVPLLMLIGGVFAFITAIVGFYSVLQRDSCLLITHASFSTLEFLILVAGIISSVRLIFFIQTGLFNADVVPELRLYETNSWVRYKWDTMQRKSISVRTILENQKQFELQENLHVVEATPSLWDTPIGNTPFSAVNSIPFRIHVV